MSKKLSIIIPIHNVVTWLCHMTGHCLGNIREHTIGLDYEVIIIDNGSPIDVKPLWSNYVDKMFVSEENLGVAKAWNVGIKNSSGDYLCFLNNDVLVYDKWADFLMESLEVVDLVTAYPMYDDPFARRRESLERTRFVKGNHLSGKKDMSCFMLKKTTADSIGLFDENYKIGYGEDVDYCRRIEASGGTIKSDKRVNTHHTIGGTSYEMLLKGFDLGEVQDTNKEYTRKKYAEV